jgi:hypothetical protein
MVTTVDAHCLRCKYYTIQGPLTGLCRREKLLSGNRDAVKPLVRADHTCTHWADCGQTYYIRLGWIKNNSRQMSR